MKNKKVFLILLACVVVIIGVFFAKKKMDAMNRFKDATANLKTLTDKNTLKEGDLIFQTSLSRQSMAVQLATHSPYSHCGIIFKKDNDFKVLEAVQPVKYTALDSWMAKGREGQYIIRRLKNSDKILTKEVIEKLKKEGNQFINKKYDIYFDWSDEKMYCSELIWKVYKRGAGIEIGKLQQLKDFDLSSKAVKEKMKERYGDNIPINDTVISPVSIFNSDLLETVTAE